MRVLPHAPLGIGDLHALEQRERRGARRGPTHSAVAADDFGDLLAHGEVRGERAHRILEHHADTRAAHAIQGRRCEPQQLGAEKAGAALRAPVSRQQAHHRKKHLALAGAGFPHHAQALTALDRECDLARGRDAAPGRVEGDGEPGQAQHGRRRRGLSARADRRHHVNRRREN